MKIFICFAIFVFSSILVMDAGASYRIELESGKTVITRHYWEENGWIKFYQFDGIIGYPAHLVRDINTSHRLPPEKHISIGVSSNKDEAVMFDLADFSQETIEKNRKLQVAQEKVQQYQNKLKNVQEKIADKANRYYMALSRSDQYAMDEAKRKHELAMNERERLLKQVQDLYEGDLPDWWYNIIEKW